MSVKSKNGEKWQSLIEGAKVAARNNDRGSAVSKFQQAYNLSRTFADQDSRRKESAYYLGFAKLLQNDVNEATQLFYEALRFMQGDPTEAPRCAELESVLASIHYEANQLEEAEQHLLSSLELERRQSVESIENIQLLASIMLRCSRYREAVSVLEKLVERQRSLEPNEVPNTLNMLSFAKQRVEQSWEDIPVILDANQRAIIQESLSSAECEARGLSPRYVGMGLNDYGRHFEKIADEFRDLSEQIGQGIEIRKRHLFCLIEALWCAEVQARNSDLLQKAYEISLVKEFLSSKVTPS